MPSVNKVILVGNLTRDPQVRQLPTQSMVAEFGIAMSRKFKGSDGDDREEVCFVDCAAFGRQAEVIEKYCRKGKSLYIEGRLRYDTWEDKSGHGKRSKLSVVVENFQFLGSREDGGPAMTQTTMDFEGRPAGASSQNGGGGRKGNWEGAKLPERAGGKETARKPFGEKVEFKEADIPF